MKILVVDDQWDVLRATGQALEFLGFTPVLAHGGKAALEKLKGGVFDVVLSDVQMPEMTGPEFYLHLQNEAFAPGLRFIFMSGSATQETLSEELGRDDLELLRKPFNLKALRAALLLNQDVEASET